MYKAYKFRIYPDENQRVLLNKSFGCARLVYNLKYQYPFLQEVDSIIIRKSIFNLDNAYQNFFKTNFSYPKFKSKNSRVSYTTSAI